MKATDVLVEEHHVIVRMLKCLTAAVAQIKDGGTFDGANIRQMIEFFRGFADRCRHGKEEAHLFPMLRERGVGCAPGSISILLGEHDEGRRHVRGMDETLEAAERGDTKARAGFLEHAEKYVQLLTEHIHKEDECLFPAANGVLSADDQQVLVAAFEQVEHEEMGEGTHEQLHTLADRLCQRWGVPIPAAAAGPHSCGHS
jgi:hemerythrin-like domain-containing protein